MKIKVMMTAIIALFLSFTSASAANYNIDNLFLSPAFSSMITPVDSGQLEGLYNLTFLGKEAGYNNALLEVRAEDTNVLFRNSVSTPGDTVSNVDLSLAAFQTNGAGAFYAANTWSGNVHIYQLLQDVTINSIAVGMGTYLLGFNDVGGDIDFDDMIVAAKPVPVPAAAWMLGAGLLGVMGLRRKKN